MLRFREASGNNPNVFGNLTHPLTARKRHICASWENPRKSKNERPCVALSSAAWGLFCSIFGLVNLLFSLLFLSSRNEQNQKNANKSLVFFSTLPHYILVRFQRNGREKTRKRWEYPVKPLREKDGEGKESRRNFVTFLNISYIFLFISNRIPSIFILFLISLQSFQEIERKR